MIGRADIEGSKSNVAMNAWLPQASYPCGNFSDTSSFKFRRTKGSIGHAFTVRIRTGNQNQTSFYPFVPHEISVLVELILGHLRYLLTDVPPQPNSPPDNVFRPDRPTEAGLGSKNRGCAPPPIHGIIGFPLSVPVLSRLFDARGRGPEGPVPNPSPDRHAATRSRRESSSSSPPTADGFGTGTPVPSPQSQSFSRGYGSILPTSLAYIVPSTRGCSPWRPDAVMSTTGRGRHSVLRIFKGRRGRTGHHATCGALPAAGPYLRLSRFQGGQAGALPDAWELDPSCLKILPKPSVQIRPHMNTRQFRGIRNNPSRHCEARQAPQQRTLFRGTGNRGHVADGLNHKRAMASTMFNRQKCTSGCLETCPFVLRPCPLEQHLAPHPSVQNGSHEKPRHVRGMPTTTHLGTVRPGRHLNRAHISEGQGDCRDDADGLNHYRAMASTMFNRQKCTSGCLDTCPFVLRLCPLRQHLAPHPSV
ncbi:hypothetical protein Lal_00046596 [Lupinus albus]|nr:hypothetical protein Lal_00046611 [Lupinus albus]KAF1856194.1 hypothetical protein Lal_00046596 [Lupinus albus]